MNSDLIIGIIGIFASLVGIPIAFVVARRSRQLPDLRHAMDFDVILNPDDRLFGHGLSMSIGAHPINSISRSRVALWNHRGDTIRGGDIVDTDPLRLQFVEGDIALQVRTLSMSRPQNKLTAKINPEGNSVEFVFDFLDAGDGSVFEIVHIGPEKPSLLGTVRGAKVRGRGNARLGPRTLVQLRKSLLRSFLEETPLRTQIYVLIYFFGGVFWTACAIVIAIVASAPGKLINIKNYNLRTISGQGHFANAVRSFNIDPTQGLLVEISLSLLAIYCFAMVARSAHPSKLPSSVIALLTDDSVQDSGSGDFPSPDHQG